MHKILISGCLLGQLVRYDGAAKPLNHHLIKQWQHQGRLISICPEVAGGLPVPRAAAELQSDNQVITRQGDNVTEAFARGAQQALSLCLTHQIKIAILKQSSPSCGSQIIYDGTFSGHKVPGQGLTCQLLQQHDIAVFCENSLSQAAEFLTTLK